MPHKIGKAVPSLAFHLTIYSLDDYTIFTQLAESNRNMSVDQLYK